jgi:hypothetical protein
MKTAATVITHVLEMGMKPRSHPHIRDTEFEVRCVLISSFISRLPPHSTSSEAPQVSPQLLSHGIREHVTCSVLRSDYVHTGAKLHSYSRRIGFGDILVSSLIGTLSREKQCRTKAAHVGLRTITFVVDVAVPQPAPVSIDPSLSGVGSPD